jgi:hypothetical protein
MVSAPLSDLPLEQVHPGGLRTAGQRGDELPPISAKGSEHRIEILDGRKLLGTGADRLRTPV